MSILFFLSAIGALGLMAWSIESFFSRVGEDPIEDDRDEHESLTD